ncbi:FAD-binding oxidoreductase [Streptomyces sp. 6N223]|uniref:FAD-binding oxidoreductase n=1 Tax=Streptomyces sp. 6N223 TaxID=3457412 RepID=UPI003FD53DC7
MSLQNTAYDDVKTLRDEVRGAVCLPGDDGYGAERTGFNTAADGRPAVAVGAADAGDVRAAVAFATAHGLPVAVRGTGHGTAGTGDGGVLITTRRMTGVRVDPDARRARLEAGVPWGRVVEAAAEHGLAPLSGSAPHVGAVAYTLGGGLPLLGRTFGYAADRVRSLDVVTADARARTVTPDADPELFWALRGARDNFGVVTALEIDLVPLERILGGGLFFDAGAPGRAEEILQAWRAWSADLPEETNTSLALVPFPPVPALPEPPPGPGGPGRYPHRGRYVAHIRVAHVGDAARGERLVAQLRALGPRLLDTLAEMPYAESGSIHGDPTQPMGFNGDTAMLDDLDEAAAGHLIAHAGPGAPVPCVVEVRRLGGALARPPAVPNAVGHRAAA